MKILFSCVPALGHAFPLLPLARAFAARGDEVAFLSAGSLAPIVAAEGFAHLSVPSEVPEIFAETIRRTGGNPADGVSGQVVAEAFAAVRLELDGEAALKLTGEWGPDLVVHEMFDFLGLFAAAALDIPAATVSLGPPVPADHIAAFAASAQAFFARHHLAGPQTLPAGRWLLDTSPEALGAWPAPDGITRLTLRPEAHQGPPADRTAPYAAPPRSGDRPLVLVSLGSVFGDPETAQRVVGDLLADQEALAADFAVTTRPGDPLVATGADRVTLLPFQPFAHQIGDADAAFVHGGAGTVLGLLAEGVPVVVMPLGADQFVQAIAVQRAGCGLALSTTPGPWDRIDPAKAREAVAEVLSDPAYRSAAQEVQAQIRSMTAPAEVAARLSASL